MVNLKPDNRQGMLLHWEYFLRLVVAILVATVGVYGFLFVLAHNFPDSQQAVNLLAAALNVCALVGLTLLLVWRGMPFMMIAETTTYFGLVAIIHLGLAALPEGYDGWMLALGPVGAGLCRVILGMVRIKR